jgi:CheY-like chemotaxis protein
MSRILIIDDDAHLRDILDHALVLQGYAVDHANNGEEALARLLNGSRYPALILLDLLMPIMDGFQFRFIQKEHPRIGEIPVTILTETLTEVELSILNPVAVIKKPLQLQSTLQIIRHLCPLIEVKTNERPSETWKE